MREAASGGRDAERVKLKLEIKVEVTLKVDLCAALDKAFIWCCFIYLFLKKIKLQNCKFSAAAMMQNWPQMIKLKITEKCLLTHCWDIRCCSAVDWYFLFLNSSVLNYQSISFLTLKVYQQNFDLWGQSIDWVQLWIQFMFFLFPQSVFCTSFVPLSWVSILQRIGWVK